jgi:EcsC family protein
MTTPDVQLSPASRRALRGAVQTLENPRLAARLADYAGQPVNRILRLMPQVASDRLNEVVKTTILKCLEVAIDSLEQTPSPPAPWLSSAMAGITGGISGAIGWIALPVELPLTTTLMLRGIADIARHEGEDLSEIAGRLACMEVFALGGNRTENRMNVGYYAARAFLARLTGEASAYLLERGVAGVSAPVLTGFVAEISSRFGIVVSDRIAASAVPVLGALGGATVNVIFMDHFQRIAQGHFTVRRLERQYGADAIHSQYADLAKRLSLTEA